MKLHQRFLRHLFHHPILMAEEQVNALLKLYNNLQIAIEIAQYEKEKTNECLCLGDPYVAGRLDGLDFAKTLVETAMSQAERLKNTESSEEAK